MNLKLYTDIALRVMLHLGQRRGTRSSVGEIMAAHAISRSHITKVVHDLARAGFIASVRGHKGGIWLARPPEAINVGALVRHAEGNWDLLGCKACTISPQCGFNPLLAEALDAFLAVLDGYTLADVLAASPGESSLLATAAGGADNAIHPTGPDLEPGGQL